MVPPARSLCFWATVTAHFQPQVTYPVSPDLQVISEPQNIVAGDFRGDGKLDLAVADYGSSYVSVLLGNGDGTFQPAVQYPLGFAPYSLATGDFAANGRLDLAVGTWGEN